MSILNNFICIYEINKNMRNITYTLTYLHILCVSLKVTLGPLKPLTRKDAEREGPERGELSKLAEFPLELKLAPPMSSGL